MNLNALTELEGAALGVIWTDGPLSAYAIRSTFRNSRSSHFSGSAGAIYPLVKRLADLGLILKTRHEQGSRASHRFSITPAGKRALRHWLNQDKAKMAAVEFDPIRSRIHFLGILTPRQRERFVHESMLSLQREIEETELLIQSRRELGEKWSVLGAMGALRTLQARLAWLGDVGEWT